MLSGFNKVSSCPFQESDEEERREKEKQERIQASLREREKEVQRTLSTSLRERDKGREQHKKEEAIQHFKALLADMVRLCIFLLMVRLYVYTRVFVCVCVCVGICYIPGVHSQPFS